ncbi:hypothetical protein ID0449_03280 [Helicobacter pylori]
MNRTYRMTNITPEAKNTNKHSVLLVEKEGVIWLGNTIKF